MLEKPINTVSYNIHHTYIPPVYTIHRYNERISDILYVPHQNGKVFKHIELLMIRIIVFQFYISIPWCWSFIMYFTNYILSTF